MKAKFHPWMLIGLFPFLMIFLGLRAIGNHDFATDGARDAAPAAPDWKPAYYRGRATVASHLKAPTSAKFSNPLNDSATGSNELRPGVWEAFGTVDSQNSFGAMRHENWRVVWDEAQGAPLYTQIGAQSWGDPKSGN